MLTTVDWEEIYPLCFLQALSSDDSDHCPLLLLTNSTIRSKQRFHFEIFWPKLDGFIEAVERGWHCDNKVTNAYRRLDCLLRNVTRELQSWAAKKIGSVKLQLLIAKELILRFDRAQEQRELSEEEFQLRKDLKKLTLGLSSLERTIARQRSRLLFLGEGDANTWFFHLHANGRRRKNHISRLRNPVTGDFATGENMATVLFDFFDNLLGTERDRPCTLNFQALDILPHDMAALELPFTENEVWSVIKELKPEKAPGPDGMTAAFYQSAWSVVKGDVLRAFDAFYTVDRRGFHCEAKDFRPISLIHSFPKFLQSF